MPNTRVKELMEMLEYETDPDKIQILEFDLAEATGGKDKGMRKGVKKRVDGGSPMTDSQKKFAALAEPKDKITFADRIAGATKKNNKVRKAGQGGYGGGDYDGDEVMAAGRCKGAGAAIRGTKFIGVR